MKRYVLRKDMMRLTGASIKRLIQNTSLPDIELVVRESIQNSLDAGVKGASQVDVDFITGSCQRSKLDGIFTGISREAFCKIPGGQADFLAIKDCNATGLTGSLDIDEYDQKGDFGNLRKLVYDICKPQSEEGKGGSWGIGKSVYFRIGIGFVIYYSRIKIGAKAYQSRLAAALIEDETNNPLIQPVINESKNEYYAGIAWWGDINERNKPMPVTDEEVDEVLDIFGIEPYSGEETGTCIIIPYIDKNKICQDANTGNSAFLRGRSLEWFIKNAVQKWYAPRLYNRKYTEQYGAFLNFKVNGQALKQAELSPFFQIVTMLYNKTFDKEKPINLRGDLKEQSAGYYEWITVSRKELNMTPPNNELSPYLLMGRNDSEDDADDDNVTNGNPPIICFCRKPGMIVNYALDASEWTRGIPKTDNDEYMLVVFRLNSENIVKAGNISLEEYVRQTEPADHMTWEDRGILEKIKKNVALKVSKETKPKDNQEKPEGEMYLQKKIGSLLLPPEGFGRKPRKPSVGSGPGGGSKGESHLPEFSVLKQEYFINGNCKLSWEMVFRKPVKNVLLTLAAVTERGVIQHNEWEDEAKGLGTAFPFQISPVQGITYTVPKDSNCKASYIRSKSGILVGMEMDTSGIDCNPKKKVVISGQLQYKVIDPLITAKIIIKEGN